MTERKIGPFQLGKQIGAGGMGIVYKAIYEETGKEVALKVLPPGLVGDQKLLKRFEREIDILKRLQHPNIVRYYGGGTHEGRRWYAMEYVDGGSLYDILKKKKKLTWEQATQVGRQLCAALEHAHNAGIIHRDLKPGNLFVTSKGKIKLGDFGIARDTEATALTAAGKTVGTYAYMAPEQIQGNTPLSRKTDLYATGCLLYELLTGETPFVTENPAEMLMMHLNSDPYNVREKVLDCPQDLDALIERLLAKNPDDRPYDALAVHTELTEILKKGNEISTPASQQALREAGASGSATIDPTTGELKPKKKKKKKDKSAFYEQTWFLVSCLVILIGAGIWLSMGPGEDSLYLAAKTAMASGDRVQQDDARRLYILPYLEAFPEGAYTAEMQQWLKDVEIGQLEAQTETRARAKRDGRNAFQKLCISAMQAESDPEKNPLEAIELYQGLIDRAVSSLKNDKESEPDKASSEKATDGDGAELSASLENAEFWKVLAERRQARLKTSFLGMDNRLTLVRDRMVYADKQLLSDNPQSGIVIFERFREAFRGDKDLEPWLDYARYRRDNQQAEMPAVPDSAK